MFKQIVTTTAGIAVASAATQKAEGPINGLGFFSVEWEYDVAGTEKKADARLGAKPVTFVDSADSYVACLTCTKTAIKGKYDCMHVKITDPKGAKTLELKGWVDLPLASFPAMTIEGKSIFEQLTNTAPDCEQSVNEAKVVTGTKCTGA